MKWSVSAAEPNSHKSSLPPLDGRYDSLGPIIFPAKPNQAPGACFFAKKTQKALDHSSRYDNISYRRGCGGIGRRAGFRCLWGQPRGGSTPLIRIRFSAKESTKQAFYRITFLLTGLSCKIMPTFSDVFGSYGGYLPHTQFKIVIA